MALVKCPECNHEVSDKAQICPNCGYKLLENNKIKVSVKVPLVASIIYTICVCIYASDYLWNTSSIIYNVYHWIITNRYNCNGAEAGK